MNKFKVPSLQNLKHLKTAKSFASLKNNRQTTYLELFKLEMRKNLLLNQERELGNKTRVIKGKLTGLEKEIKNQEESLSQAQESLSPTQESLNLNAASPEKGKTQAKKWDKFVLKY